MKNMKTPEEFLNENGITNQVIEVGCLSMRNLILLIQLRDADHEIEMKLETLKNINDDLSI